MPKTRSQKEALIELAADRLERAKAAVFAKINGFTMAEADELRGRTSGQGLVAFVLKRTLLKRALNQAKISGLDVSALDGSLLTLVGFDDEISPAKTLVEFSKKHESLTILAGLMNGQAIGNDCVRSLAALPGRLELLGHLVGSIRAPLAGLANILSGNLRGLVRILQAIEKSKSS